MKSSTPRILMFGWEFPPFNSGGLGTACYGLTRALSQQGAEIVFVLPRKVGVSSEHIQIRFADASKLSEEENVDYKEAGVLLYPYITETQYAAERNFLCSVLGGEVPYAGDLYCEVMRYATLSKEIAQSERFDVIHAHDWLSFPAGMQAKRVSGKHLVAHVHATEFDRTGGNGVNERVYQIEREGMHQADKIIAVSNYTKNIITEQYHIKPQKVEVVHNGIDEDYFHQQEEFENRFHALKEAGNKVVLFLGRLTIQKGPDYFIKAAKKVLQYEKKVIFLVAGSGDMEKSMMHMVADMGISDKVLFAGFLRGKELCDIYKAADLYVMPSISEPFGLTALESMLNHTPVLVSRQTGVSESVKSVLKVDFWDVDEMANKIVAVLRYGSLHHCLSTEGREEVKRVGWCEAAQKCLNVYNNLIYQY